MRTPLVAGNWKLNGSRPANAQLVDAVLAGVPAAGKCRVMVCPPYVYLADIAQRLQGTSVELAAQDVAEQPDGAFTGEVSAAMLAELGCTHTLIGHSERRTLFGETDNVTAGKFIAAQEAGLIPILCVGETLSEREAGQTQAVVDRQLAAVLDASSVHALATAVVAYEPVWAIGTGLTATPEQAQAVHSAIRSRVAAADAKIAENLIILYGGSMKPGNAAELLAMPDIDGGLIGGASLVAEDFLAICAAAAGTA